MIIDDRRGDDAYWMHIMHFVRYKNDVFEGEKRGVSMHVVLRPFASAHFRGRECALSGLRVRTLRPASAHSFSAPSTVCCSGVSARGVPTLATDACRNACREVCQHFAAHDFLGFMHCM